LALLGCSRRLNRALKLSSDLEHFFYCSFLSSRFDTDRRFGDENKSTPLVSKLLTRKNLESNNMSVVFHGFLAPALKAAAISVSLEIFLRGFLVDTLRRCSQQVWFFLFPA
jgi:hypothetical protein